MANGFTPIQTKMMELLSDGLPHTEEELRKCLYDDMACSNAVNFHLSSIRKIIRPRGQDVACEKAFGKVYYRHVRMLGSSYQ